MHFLKDDFYCVAIDLRGHGRSSKPYPADYSFDAHVADIHCLLAKLKIDKPALVGWSLGGLVSQLYAATYPHQLRQLVLVDTGPQGDSTPDFPFGIPVEDAARLIKYLEAGQYLRFLKLLDKLNFTDQCADGCDCKTKAKYELLKEKLHQISLQARPEAILAGFQQNGTRSLISLLPQIRAPTLIVVGSLDLFYPFQAARVMREAIPRSVLVEFNSKGHSAFLTDATKFNKLLWSFLTETDKNCDICTHIEP
jgi:pimeloyl-ACP methyl ester carboxylesterase